MTTVTTGRTTTAVQPPLPARAAALAGIAAGLGALVVGEVAGRVVPGAAPPLVAVGDTVIRLAPPALRDGGIEAFGTADKPILLVTIAVVIAGLAALAGMLARLHPREGEAAVALLGAVALVAQLAKAGTTSAGGLCAAALTVVVGIVLLRALMGRVPWRAPDPRPEAAPTWSRRAFILRSSVVIAVATVGGTVAQWLDGRVDVDRIRALRVLRPPVRPAPGDVLGSTVDVPGISPLFTPNRDFYRIDTALVVPAIDPETWSLGITGMVDRPLSLTYDELLAMPQFEADITMQCVSNEVGGELVGNARWQGVLLKDLLEIAGVQRGAGQVVGRSVDDFTAGFPTEVALDGRPAMVALGMNGEPLPQLNGFPARLVVPGLYGYVSATKWLQAIELTTWEGFDGFWVPRGWSKLGPVKLASRIDVPRDSSTVAAGSVVVAGVAWAPGPKRGVVKVEVSVDDGDWTEADLGGALSQDAWRQWRATVELAPGQHVLKVRATDRTGVVQDASRRAQRPDGATGHHGVLVVAR
ncbi:MAG: molybdopterin-dependent oxidoreductase [Mycobacteriales bacterium]|nr:molybdopterin-dependent oxidoreductase [Mycobacteriales bacterium]